MVLICVLKGRNVTKSVLDLSSALFIQQAVLAAIYETAAQDRIVLLPPSVSSQ